MTDEKFFDLTAESLPPRLYSVLILEDDHDFAQLLKDFLESSTFEVHCVTNGADGLRQVMARDFDIIICDLNMPNLPGDKFHFAVERAKNKLTKRFIFMTGHASDPKWSGFLAKVTGPVLEKPFTMQEMLSTIQTLLTSIELAGE